MFYFLILYSFGSFDEYIDGSLNFYFFKIVARSNVETRMVPIMILYYLWPFKYSMVDNFILNICEIYEILINNKCYTTNLGIWCFELGEIRGVIE